MQSFQLPYQRLSPQPTHISLTSRCFFPSLQLCSRTAGLSFKARSWPQEFLSYNINLPFLAYPHALGDSDSCLMKSRGLFEFPPRPSMTWAMIRLAVAWSPI